MTCTSLADRLRHRMAAGLCVVILGGGAGSDAAPLPVAARSALVAEEGFLFGRAAGATLAEAVDAVARAAGVTLRWAGSPGCERHEVALAGVPVEQAVSRLLDGAGRSYRLRFKRTPDGERLSDIAVLPGPADDAACVLPERVPASASAPQTEHPEAPERPQPTTASADPAAIAAWEIVRNTDADAGERIAALQRLLESDEQVAAAIDHGLRDRDAAVRLTALRSIGTHASGVDWSEELRRLATSDAVEAVRNLAAGVLHRVAPTPRVASEPRLVRSDTR